jgi:hypothetical protein
MNRKKFLKSACGLGICSCMGIGLLASDKLSAAVVKGIADEKKTPLVPVNARQIQNVLGFVDSSVDEPTKKSIFEKLGTGHLKSDNFKNFLEKSKKNLKAFFEDINSGKDTYWEKIEYNYESSSLKITGKKVDRCACSYAQTENPPLSLCNYCCSGFQKAMFEMLLDKHVTKVEIDESYLFGGNRCSSTVFINGKLEFPE